VYNGQGIKNLGCRQSLLDSTTSPPGLFNLKKHQKMSFREVAASLVLHYSAEYTTDTVFYHAYSGVSLGGSMRGNQSIRKGKSLFQGKAPVSDKPGGGIEPDLSRRVWLDIILQIGSSSGESK
jgi:hypothetical protein